MGVPGIFAVFGSHIRVTEGGFDRVSSALVVFVVESPIYSVRQLAVILSPQKRQDGSAFALTCGLLLRSCKLMGGFVISPLPPFLLEPLQTAGPLRSAEITPLLRYYRPGRIPLAVHRLPGVTGYTASLLRRFLNGARRASPVA